MKLGLLADIHEHTEQLRKAIDTLQRHKADRFIVLGDLIDTGKHIDETVQILREVHAAGVWGNHDFGLCFNPDAAIRVRYGAAVLDFMGGIKSHLEIDGCLFTHVEPWLDPHKIEDLWYADGPPDSPEKLAKSFAAVSHRIIFMGHLHQWLVATPAGVQAWRGDCQLRLDRASRYLVVVHAVCDGRCALFETSTGDLIPFGEP